MYVQIGNDSGSITFGTKSNDIYKYKLTAIEGLGPVGKSLTSAKYYNQPGQITTDISVGTRTITICGDVPIDSYFKRSYLNLYKILNDTVIIYICPTGGESDRMIEGVCTSFTPGERNGAYQSYVIQLTCDYPYFSSDVSRSFIGYRITNRLNSAFEFPGIFTTQISNATLSYEGDVKTEPDRIIINCPISAAEDSSVDIQGEGVLITNETTGESIRIDYELDEGDSLTIDVVNRKITNGTGENCIMYLADDSFLDGFHLEPGDNVIGCTNYSTGKRVLISIKYTNKYLGVVY